MQLGGPERTKEAYRTNLPRRKDCARYLVLCVSAAHLCPSMTLDFTGSGEKTGGEGKGRRKACSWVDLNARRRPIVLICQEGRIARGT